MCLRAASVTKTGIVDVMTKTDQGTGREIVTVRIETTNDTKIETGIEMSAVSEDGSMATEIAKDPVTVTETVIENVTETEIEIETAGKAETAIVIEIETRTKIVLGKEIQNVSVTATKIIVAGETTMIVTALEIVTAIETGTEIRIRTGIGRGIGIGTGTEIESDAAIERGTGETRTGGTTNAVMMVGATEMTKTAAARTRRSAAGLRLIAMCLEAAQRVAERR